VNTTERTESSHQHEESLIGLGQRARDAGKSLEALRRFDEATAAAPDNPVGFAEAATTLREMRLSSQARTRVESVLPRWPDRWDLLIELARVASTQGDTSTALTSYDRVIQLAPDAVWAEPYIGAASQLRVLDRLGEAEGLLDRGIAACAADEVQRTHILEAKAALLLSADRYSEAVAALASSISTLARLPPILDAAAVLTRRGDFHAALRLLKDLQPVVRQHCSDSWTYDKYIDAVTRAGWLVSAIEHRSRYDGRSQVLRLEPHIWTSEEPLDSVSASIESADAPPTRHYVLVDAAAEDSTGRAFPTSFDAPLSGDQSLFPYPFRRQQRAHFTYVLPRAHVFDNLGIDVRSIVLFNETAFAPDLLAYHYPAALGRLALRDSARATADPIQLAFMLPSGSGWLNYYHAVVDIFSALSVYTSLGLSCPIVTPGPMGRLHWDLLQFSGIPEETQLFSADQIRDHTIDQLICPEQASGQLVRDWCAHVAARVPPLQRDTPAPSILYISRRHAPIRSLTNETELQEALKKRFGAETLPMEDLAFDTQVDLARRAKIIIGPHGAGLTNVCFAEQGAWLIELLPDRHPVPIFRDLAAAVGVHYVPIGGQVDDLDSLSWHVDVDNVLNVVLAALDHC
jgi:tetratricopeptide (TPR) repeat protein